MQTLITYFFCVLMALQTLLGQFPPAARFPREPEHAAAGDTCVLPLHDGADPWYYQYGGRYYYCYSVGNGVAVKQADTLAALGSAPGTVVYRAPTGTAYSCDYWAPELHCIDGGWYIYVAADDGANENHRMYVLRGDAPDGAFEMVGKLCDPADRWAIDGTVLRTAQGLWFIWSGWEGDADGQQNLYIAPMDSPTHICGTRVCISRPEKNWEKNGMPVNEGPEILQRDGRTYLIYSASGSWTDAYCLGMLRLAGDDPAAPGSWAKCPVPVFRKADAAFGPGHCSFVSSADGGTDYIVYHANTESGTGWNGRSVRIQRFTWRCGVPVFGAPLPAGSEVKLY